MGVQEEFQNERSHNNHSAFALVLFYDTPVQVIDPDIGEGFTIKV